MFVEPDYIGKEDIQISMDGKGRALDNIFTERLWRTVKYELVTLIGRRREQDEHVDGRGHEHADNNAGDEQV